MRKNILYLYDKNVSEKKCAIIIIENIFKPWFIPLSEDYWFIPTTCHDCGMRAGARVGI